MTATKRIINAISTVLCFTILWIPFHFALKTLLYGDKREQKKSTNKEAKTE